MDKELIKGLIAEYQQFVKGVSFVKRAVTLSDNFNYVFVGLRRVGKSYLMYQQIHHLIETGISPEEILFFNFEDERLRPYESSLLADVLDAVLVVGIGNVQIAVEELVLVLALHVHNLHVLDGAVIRLADVNAYHGVEK